MAERRFKIALGVLILVALYAALVPWLADVDDRVTDFSAARLAPSFDHPFGTDSAGRDLFVRIAAGIRTSLLIALACALLAPEPGDRVLLLSEVRSRVTDAEIAEAAKLLERELSAPGYVPRTISGDGDPVDVLVITPVPLIPGVVVTCRALGMMKMEDEAGGDNKLLAVPIDKILSIYSQWKKPEDLNPLRLKTIQHFFEHYKDLEPGKWVKVTGWDGIDAAKAALPYLDVRGLAAQHRVVLRRIALERAINQSTQGATQ